MNLKAIAKWATGILFGVAVVAVADDYLTTRDYRWDRKLLKEVDNLKVEWVD